VVGVVADHVGSELANGDAAAFGVNSECVPLLGGECAEEVQVGLAQQAVQEERVVGFSGCIVAEVCPEILVEADQGDSRMFDDLAVAPSSGDLIFGEMSEDFGDGPLVWCWFSSETIGRDIGDELGDAGGRLRLGYEWIFAFCVFANAGEVVGCVGQRKCSSRKSIRSKGQRAFSRA